MKTAHRDLFMSRATHMKRLSAIGMELLLRVDIVDVFPCMYYYIPYLLLHASPVAILAEKEG